MSFVFWDFQSGTHKISWITSFKHPFLCQEMQPSMMPHSTYTSRWVLFSLQVLVVAQFLLQRILSLEGDTVHFMAEKWLSFNQGLWERVFLHLSHTRSLVLLKNYRVTGWTNALKNTRFTESLVYFFGNNWEDDNLAHICFAVFSPS